MKFNRQHPCFVAALDLEPQGEEIKVWQPRIQTEVIQ